MTPRVWNVMSVQYESAPFISAWVLHCLFYSEWQCESLETAERAKIDFHASFLFRRFRESTGKTKQQLTMKKSLIALTSVCALALMSCSTITTGAGIGAIYTGVTEGQTATSNEVGSKVGTSSSIGVLGLVAVGDASIQKAANQAGIKKISHVDVKKTSVLGLFAQYQTIVYGD